MELMQDWWTFYYIKDDKRYFLKSTSPLKATDLKTTQIWCETQCLLFNVDTIYVDTQKNHYVLYKRNEHDLLHE